MPSLTIAARLPHKPAVRPAGRTTLSAPLPRLTFVLGGARSGKSAHGEALVLGSGLDPVYVATAEPLDEEMGERIRHHRARRGPAWTTLEEPLRLADLLLAQARPGRAILVDCLTLWLTNLLMAQRDIEAEGCGLVAALGRTEAPVVLISNEVGLGIVPLDPLTRAFVDHAGRLHQRVAAAADRVLFMTAGLPLVLKPTA